MTQAQMLYCGMVLVVEIFLMWFYDQVPGGQAEATQAYIVANLMLACLWPQSKQTDQQQSGPVAGSRQVNTGSASPPKARTFFLDNVKVFCTVLVLIHHITIGFGGNGTLDWAIKIGNFKNSAFARYSIILLAFDQSFFMCLLFFIGGIFLPSSFKRKGAPGFIRERVKRFGWPVVVTFFVAMPFFRSVWGSVLVGGSWSLYTQAHWGVCWFLISLIVLSLAFAIVPWSSVKVAFPSTFTLIIAGVTLGILQGFTNAYKYNATWVGIQPASIGAMPVDLAFFAAGCIAKENGWLDAISNLAAKEYWLVRGTSLVAFTAAVSYLLVARPNLGWVDCADPNAEAHLAGSKFAPHLPSNLLEEILLGAVGGVLSTTLSVSVLHFFALHFNSQGWLAKLMSEAQYGVYVLQTFIIPFVMWTFIMILEAAGHKLEFVYCSGAPVSSTDISQGLIVGGWLYTITLVNLILWPLAHFFRKLPGVRDIL